ncbi:MAG TPA: VanZ family protein [Chitinophagaceae bacterium]|nr:VanZ family protein [Chitinophagaceae bacterium]
MKNNSLSFLLAVSWLLISTFLLTIPGTRFPKEDWLSKLWFDKWVHIGIFSLMVFLWCWFFYKSAIKKANLINYFLVTALCCFAYGTGMEFVQKYFVSNRSFDLGDIIADGVGCVAGLIYSWGRYIKK